MAAVFAMPLILAIPFVLPALVFFSLRRLRLRVTSLEETIEEQRVAIDALKRRVRERHEPAAEAKHGPAPHVEAPVSAPEPVMPPPALVTPPLPKPLAAPAVTAAAMPRSHVPSTPVPSPPALPAASAFDWENVIGIKLFSAVAGIALVLAAIFFLRYSVDHGWLAPQVRVAIGMLVAIVLLVVCERAAARKYPVTANALDAASVAILFSTFFAAHALWHLIPAGLTFALLALVAVLAVLLSIRHESMFVAVLGLLGGFATPALLSTGENQPMPLFSYLLILNIGLAWVASKKRWPILNVLTLVLTAIYQWGWVVRFLASSSLSLAMGVFLVFAIVAVISLVTGGDNDTEMERARATTSLGATVMPLVFTIYVASVTGYGAHAPLMFGFLLLLDAGFAAIAIAGRRLERAGALVDAGRLHMLGAITTAAVFIIWLTRTYAPGDLLTAVGFAAAFVILYSLVPVVAARLGQAVTGQARRAEYVAPCLLFVVAVIARIDPAAATPLTPFGILFALLGVIAWRSLASAQPGLYFVAAFFALVAEAAWSATFLTTARVPVSILLYAAFGLFYLGVPLAARRLGRELTPAWATGALTIASLGLLLFLASGTMAPAAIWGLALLLAILNAGLFIESASGRMPWLSAAGALLSWLVLAVWWDNAAATVGLLPSLLVLVGLALVMFVGHSRAHIWVLRQDPRTIASADSGGFQHGIYLGLVGHLFLFGIAQNAAWSTPPWPMFGALLVMTMGAGAAALVVEAGELHAAAVVASAVVLLAWTVTSLPAGWALVAVAAIEAVAAYGLVGLGVEKRTRIARVPAAVGAAGALFVAEITLIVLSTSAGSPGLAIMTAAHVVNVSLILAISWRHEWRWVAPAAVIPAWLTAYTWHELRPQPEDWSQVLTLAASLYGVFTAYPFVLYRRARDNRDPHLTAVAASAFFFFMARTALIQGGLTPIVGVVPVVEAAIMAGLLRELLSIEAPNQRDLGRLALVAAAALAFVTVAIPLQLDHQWITIGWALEGIALAWLYRRVPHRGLLVFTVALLGAVFVRLALNPAVFVYEPRGMRLFNWYLYTYVIAGASMLAAGWLLSKTDDRLIPDGPQARAFLPAAGVILLFLVLNIEIADFYATGPEITFRFGVSIAQDLTYTIGWLIFGLLLLMACIRADTREGRIAAVALIAVTTFKAFLYDTRSLEGLYRVGSLVGLAVSLALVALALQKFALQQHEEAS